MRKVIFALLILAFVPVLVAQGLNNSTVVKLAKAGLADDVIIATINASPGTYDTSANGLIALKHAGVSDRVIAAIVLKSVSAPPPPAALSAPAPAPAAPAPAAPADPPSAIDHIGVYYKDSTGNWQMLPNEEVVFQSGGLIKHMATAGLMKQDLNGLVGGMRSRLVVRTPADLVLHVPQGRSPSDYQLLRLHVAGNNRQFQSVAGGLNRETAGALRDNVEFTSKEIAPSTYQIVLNGEVGEGEFGFLEPQPTSSSATPPSSGKIFTFAVVN